MYVVRRSLIPVLIEPGSTVVTQTPNRPRVLGLTIGYKF